MDEDTQKRLLDAAERRSVEVVAAARTSLEQAFINCEAERRFAAGVAARLPEDSLQRKHYEEISADRHTRAGQLLLELDALTAELAEQQARLAAKPPAASAPAPSSPAQDFGTDPNLEVVVDGKLVKAAAKPATRPLEKSHKVEPHKVDPHKGSSKR